MEVDDTDEGSDHHVREETKCQETGAFRSQGQPPSAPQISPDPAGAVQAIRYLDRGGPMADAGD